MVGRAWFMYPVSNGVELVIGSAEDAIYEQALAAFVAEFPDANLAGEWAVAGGHVLHFVPAPVDTAGAGRSRPDTLPAPRTPTDSTRERSAAERAARAAHPAGKGRGPRRRGTLN